LKLLEIKITLLDVRPPIWRTILLSPEITLGKLHRILQVAIGWEERHFHRFRRDDQMYSDPKFEMEDRSADERKARIGELLIASDNHLIYEYDFGDGWRHELTLEGTPESDVQAPYVLCTDGKRACPPEDCGGPRGLSDLLCILKNPKHPDSEAMREWVGHGFDPEAFDVDETNKRLSRLFRSWL
jgi:hypothetical protein